MGMCAVKARGVPLCQGEDGPDRAPEAENYSAFLRKSFAVEQIRLEAIGLIRPQFFSSFPAVGRSRSLDTPMRKLHIGIFCQVIFDMRPKIRVIAHLPAPRANRKHFLELGHLLPGRHHFGSATLRRRIHDRRARPCGDTLKWIGDGTEGGIWHWLGKGDEKSQYLKQS